MIDQETGVAESQAKSEHKMVEAPSKAIKSNKKNGSVQAPVTPPTPVPVPQQVSVQAPVTPPTPVPVPQQVQVRPAIGASLKGLSQLSVKVDGLYVPGVQHPAVPNVWQLLAFQGVLLGIFNDPVFLLSLAVVRLTNATGGVSLQGTLTDFQPGAHLVIPHKDSTALQKYLPWSGVDSAGNRFMRVYEIAYIPSPGDHPGVFYGAELSQLDVAALRLLPGGGVLLVPGGMFAPTNAKDVGIAVNKLKEGDIAF